MDLYFVWKEIETYDSSNRYDHAIFNNLRMAYDYGNTLSKEDYNQNYIKIPIENVLDVGNIWINNINSKQYSVHIRKVSKEIADKALKESGGKNFTLDVFRKIYDKLKHQIIFNP